MSWFSKLTTSTVIIISCNALVPYHLSKGFFIVEKVVEVFVNILDPVFKKISISILHDEDKNLACKA